MDAVDRERRYRRAVQPILDEPVLACGLFHGNGIELPDEFLLAVTPTRVHAFEAAAESGEIGPGIELAVWERVRGG